MIENMGYIEGRELSEYSDKDFELNSFQQEKISQLPENTTIEELTQNETLRNEFIEKVDNEVKLLKPKLNTAIALDRALHPTMEKFLKDLNSKYLEAPTDTAQIKEISDYLSLREDLKFDNWKNLSLEQKVNLLDDLEKTIAKIEHRPPLTLHAANLEEGCWGKNYGDRMEVNSKYLELSSKDERCYWETLDTLIHEGRHTYQNYNLNVRNIHSRPSQIESWRENHELGYRDGYKNIPIFGLRYADKESMRDYRFQPVEIDAREFAKDTITQLKEKWKGNIDIYEQYQERNSVLSKGDSRKEGKPVEGIGTLAKTESYEPPFTDKYTDAEISRIKSDVSSLEYKLNYANQKVNHWEKCYNTSHDSGDLSRLNNAISERNNISSHLSAANSRLRNAT